MTTIGEDMLAVARQIWLRKAATMLAVFASLLIGTVGSDVLALCVGEGHVAVELSQPAKKIPTGAGISNFSNKNCVDAALLSSVRVERPMAGAPDLGGKDVLPLLTNPVPSRSLATASALHWFPAQIDIDPALKHLRTVVLLN